MNQQRVFQVERFYFGTFIQNGQPTGAPQVVAKSPGITQAHVQECLRLVRIAPPPPDADDMPAAIGLFQGEQIEHIYLKAGRTPQGFPQLEYQIVPPMALRWLGGNFTHFFDAAQEAMPAFDAPRVLEPASINNPAPLDDSKQIDLLYDLFRYSGDKVKNVEGLAAALIHHLPIAILNAPPDLKTRMRFIEGLLCLMPAPARVGMTWATAVEKPDETLAGIKFLSRTTQPVNHLLFDWAEGKLLNHAPADKYSKFIASRLRLDASQVVETTSSIARTAIWRAMRKDSLPQALYVASRRAAVDEAVQNKQPAERELVAAILRQDPTLSDEMRVLYARHLLALTLSLDDEPEHADVIPMVAAKNRPVAEVIYAYLKDLASDDRPLRVFELIKRWAENVPQTTAIPWHRLAHIGAVTHLENLLRAGHMEEGINFIADLMRSHERLQVQIAVPQLITASKPHVQRSPKLGLSLFLLANEHLTTAQFQKFLTEPEFLRVLPRRIQQAALHLQNEPRPSPPPGVLAGAIHDVALPYRLLVLGRLADCAVQLKRGELIDSRMMASLLRLAESPEYVQRFDILFDYLVRQYSQPQNLQRLEAPAQEILPLIFFQIAQPESGVRLLENFQFTLFTADKLPTFVDLVGRIFSKVNLPAPQLDHIFTLLDKSKLRPKPRARAYMAALLSHKWATAYRSLAQRLTGMLHQDASLLTVIGLENTMQLLGFHAEQKDRAAALQTGTALLEAALNAGTKGIQLVEQIWERLRWEDEMRGVGIELLRRYVREVDGDFVSTLPKRFGEKMGSDIREQLEATYIVRLALGDQDLSVFADQVVKTSQFLFDVALTYAEGRDRPPLHRLRQFLDPMSGGLDDNERKAIGVSIEYIARAVYVLGSQRPLNKQTRQRAEKLLSNDMVPGSGWDLLVFTGGYFADHQLEQVDLERLAPAYVLGNRSANILVQEVPLIARLLGNLLRALPHDKPPALQLEALISELESRQKLLPEAERGAIRLDLATHCQHLAWLMQELTSGVNERVLNNKQLESGKKQPENGLQALVWISGYFNRLHQT